MKARLSDKYFSSSINLDNRRQSPSPVPTALNHLEIEFRNNCEAWEFKRKGENFSEWSEAKLLSLKHEILESRQTFLKSSYNEAKEVPLYFRQNQFFESLTVLMERYKERNFTNENARLN